MNVGVRAIDDRKIEVLAQDLPCFGARSWPLTKHCGAWLAGTVSPDHTPRRWTGQFSCKQEPTKRSGFQRLTTGRCRLVVVAIEKGGRWSEEAVDLLWQLSCAKARDVPHFMTHQAAPVWERRWSRMFSTSCALAFAASLVEPAQNDHMCEAGGEPPSVAEVLLHNPKLVV